MSATILIVEDDRQFACLLARQLQESKYASLHASDGVQALQMLRQHQPDLVLLDLLMPNMDGWQTLRHIREISDVPVIILSCINNEVDKVRCLQMGADDYITKPLSRLEGMARIAVALRRASHAAPDPVLRVDDHLAVDRARHDAYVDGQPMNLSAIEYKLLTCLLDNAGSICTPRRLLNDVWGWEYTDEISYLKVYIHHLRQKIEPDPSNPRYVLTERGKGYIFQIPSLCEPSFGPS